MTAMPQAAAAIPGAARKRERMGVAVLLALAWFQVAFASHQFEHVTGDLLDICTVCKHFERHESPLAGHAAKTVPAADFLPAVAPAARVYPGGFRSHHHPRAPPSA